MNMRSVVKDLDRQVAGCMAIDQELSTREKYLRRVIKDLLDKIHWLHECSEGLVIEAKEEGYSTGFEDGRYVGYTEAESDYLREIW